ncbi:MAG: type II secretion system protein M [Gammaproteobacteria bacterium]|nr:type II secretion system protein M [Gammaproteobacteria bacterium]
MKDWFLGLESGERLTLITGAVILALVLVWILLINPLYISAGARGGQINSARDNVARARQLSVEIATLRNTGNAAANPQDTLMITLERTARQSGLQVNQSRPIDKTTVRVRFESAPFDALVQWMGLLERNHGIHIEIASLDRLDVPGMVDAQLTLKRPG